MAHIVLGSTRFLHNSTSRRRAFQNQYVRFIQSSIFFGTRAFETNTKHHKQTIFCLFCFGLLVYSVPINNWPTQRFRFSPSGWSTAGPNLFQGLSTARYLLHDRFHGGGRIRRSGFSFQAAMNSVIAFSRSSMLRQEPRRIRLLVNSPNQRSTRFSQLELVGTKCDTKRGWRFSQAWTLGCLCVP